MLRRTVVVRTKHKNNAEDLNITIKKRKESDKAMHINKALINKTNEWKTGVSVSINM